MQDDSFRDNPEAMKRFKLAKKILIIDDDFDIRLSLAELLVNEGYKVATARDGQAGIAYLVSQKELPSLVLLDLNMPVADGLNFREQQKKIKEISDIPVVVISADKYVGEKARSTDAKAIIKKPVDLFEILNAVEKYSMIEHA